MAKCPICSSLGANSPHHIRPSSDGGSDNHRNKVLLCKGCHDVVEEIYCRTGAELSPDMIALIRLEYRFSGARSIDASIREASLQYIARDIRRSIRNTKRRFRYAKKGVKEVPGGIAIWCAYCRKYHHPDKRGIVVCPEYRSQQYKHAQGIYNPEVTKLFDELRKKLVGVHSN